MRDALAAALQSHQRMGKAAPCDCSLCKQVREALSPAGGANYRQRLREECAQVADWVADQLAARERAGEVLDPAAKAAVKAAREIGTRIRLLDQLSH